MAERLAIPECARKDEKTGRSSSLAIKLHSLAALRVSPLYRQPFAQHVPFRYAASVSMFRRKHKKWERPIELVAGRRKRDFSRAKGTLGLVCTKLSPSRHIACPNERNKNWTASTSLAERFPKNDQSHRRTRTPSVGFLGFETESPSLTKRITVFAVLGPSFG